ncbi:hypothetical protein [Actinokineospora sp. NPDC004072]
MNPTLSRRAVVLHWLAVVPAAAVLVLLFIVPGMFLREPASFLDRVWLHTPTLLFAAATASLVVLVVRRGRRVRWRDPMLVPVATVAFILALLTTNNLLAVFP